jgi:hypothetical protein
MVSFRMPQSSFPWLMKALPYHPDMVITRDKKGFNDLEILVMTPAEFVQEARE